MALSRDEILAVNDCRTVEVQVPEWGGSVLVRVMSGRDRDRFEFMVQKDKDAGKSIDNFRAKFCASIVCDEQGKALFSEADIEALGNKSAAALDRILTRGLELAGMDQGALDQAGEG